MSIKFKFLTKDELIISLDRLSRFKLPEEKYLRVFSNIICKYLIEPKYSKKELEQLPYSTISSIVEEIWNKSVENIYGKTKEKNSFNILKFLEEHTFKNIDKNTQTLINTSLKIKQILKTIDYENSPDNLKFLIKSQNIRSIKKIISIREKYELMFPIEKLIIVEGITEEILLPVFSNKLNYNFKQKGIYILGAGGKSKSPSLYMKLKDKIKIPIILLFDNDAEEICEILNKNLEQKDKTILIKQGEFEDILSLNLLKRVLNSEYKPATQLRKNELRVQSKMCDNITNFYRTRHLGEFKKSKLSKLIAENVKYETDITTQIKDIIGEIIQLD